MNTIISFVFLITTLYQVSSTSDAGILRNCYKQERDTSKNKSYSIRRNLSLREATSFNSDSHMKINCKSALRLLNEFLKAPNMKFKYTLEEFQEQLQKKQLTNKLKIYIDNISINLRTTNHQRRFKLILVLTIYILKLSNKEETTHFLEDAELQKDIITVLNTIETYFINPLFLSASNKEVRTTMKGKKKYLPKSALKTTEQYKQYEDKLNALHEVYDVEYKKSFFKDRKNKINSLFFGLSTDMRQILSILAVMLQYESPEVLFIYCFFYPEVNGTRKRSFYVEKNTLDGAFYYVVDRKITLDMLISDVKDYHKECNLSQSKNCADSAGGNVFNMQFFMEFIIEKYKAIKNTHL